MYNTQLLFDADGALIQRRRKISPTYHERMVWGQGDGSGCAPSIAWWAASVSWRAGSITTRWRATR
jgi:predicted amidohydrolase